MKKVYVLVGDNVASEMDIYSSKEKGLKALADFGRGVMKSDIAEDAWTTEDDDDDDCAMGIKMGYMLYEWNVI